MADFNLHLKKSKVLVFFTIFAFLYMTCFMSCSKPKNQEKIEIAQKSGRTEKSEAPKTETASNQETAESNNSTQSDKSDDPCGCPPGVNGSAENAEQQKPLTQEELNKMADAQDRYFQALGELIEEIPRDTFDPQTVVDKVGKAPEALFQWVKDNTDFIPYQGALRGPIGVLMERRGNSLDRALLLNRLLSLAGYRVRFARRDLAQVDEQRIMEGVRRLQKTKVSGSEKRLSVDINKVLIDGAKKYQLDVDRLQWMVSNKKEEQDKLAETIRARVEEQVRFINALISESGKKQSQISPNRGYQELREHWWVQLEKDNKWVDLDPTLKDTNPGQALFKEKETLEPDNIPASSFHSVKLSVIIEQLKGGKLKEKTILSHSLDLNSLDKRVVLWQMPLNWPDDISLSKDENLGEKIKDAIFNEKNWVPILTIGEKQIKQNSFTAAGETSQQTSRTRQGIGGLSKGLFGALGGSEDKEQTEDGQLTAEWIEFEIYSPGQNVKKVRRQIFDLIGHAARQGNQNLQLEISETNQKLRALAVLTEVEIFVQTGDISPEYLYYLTAKSLLTYREAVSYFAHALNSSTISILMSKFSGAKPIPFIQLNLAFLRNILSNYQNSIYLDSPNIINYVRRLSLHSEGKLIDQAEIDIVSNDVSFLPDPNNDESFAACLYQGVLDTNIEAILLQRLRMPVINASEMLFNSKKEGLEWVLIDGPNNPTYVSMNIPKDIRSSIDADMASGFNIILPKKPVSTQENKVWGWWRMNPLTGNIIGVGQNRSGQAMSEVIGVTAAVALCFLAASGVNNEWSPGVNSEWRPAAYFFCSVAAVGGIGIIFFYQHGSAICWAIVIAITTGITGILREKYPEPTEQ